MLIMKVLNICKKYKLITIDKKCVIEIKFYHAFKLYKQKFKNYFSIKHFGILGSSVNQTRHP